MPDPDLRCPFRPAWLLALCCGTALADPGAAAPASPEPTDAAIEAARTSARETAIWLARGVDSWFGDRPFAEGGKVSDGRLGLQSQVRGGNRPSVGLRFNARFVMPNLDRLSYAFIGRDDRSEVLADTPQALSRQERLVPPSGANQGFFAGLGRTLGDHFDLRLGLRGGLHLYAQARYQHHWQPAAADHLDFKQTFFWTRADRLGSSTALSYDHALAPDLALRWVNAATITQSLPEIAWSSVAGAYRSFGAQRVASFELLADGQSGSAPATRDRGLQLGWQQPLRRNQLLGALVLGYFRTRTDPGDAARGEWALGGRLELRF
ncbi:MAG: hypothetical protein KGL43_12410 [Burkholderiales bacterium]|nr:hypothetical protein [Burkholderiales bacterium]MDE2395058.1 hypothetical protein [Burkholderiales bacterium]MDE2454387.1 hypothetical protein [Burkholderiales bacterium]